MATANSKEKLNDKYPVSSVKKTRIQWMLDNMQGLKLLYLIAIIGAIIYNVMHITVPFFISKLIDTFITGENASENLANGKTLFYTYIIAMVLLTLLRTSIVYGAGMIFEYVSQEFLYRMRMFLYNKIQRQDMKFYNTYRTGDLMTRMTGDLDACRHMIAWVIKTILESVSLFGATMVYFYILDPIIATCILLMAPCIFAVIIVFKNNVGPKHRMLREKLAYMNTIVQENIAGNRVVKAFAREDHEIEKFNDSNMDFCESNTDTALTWMRYFPVVETFANIMPICLLIAGGLSIMSGRLTYGEYAAFNGLIWAVQNPMRNLGNVMNEFQRFHASSAKVMEIYYSEPEIVDSENAIDKPERFKGKIEFKNVSFKYDDAPLPVLHDISFVANPGETIAIMGETGCGKSSLIHLIPRFYEATQGEVLVDDINVSDLKLKQLRGNIGLATQEVLLYSDTIDGNIAYGDDELEHDEVMQFAHYSAADFIEDLPEGYETVVGERGVGLSGGQKQRISLARALAVKPAILILDDTTSAVDMETEKKIQNRLNNLDFSCTKIIITQRTSTAQYADKILIIKDGYISESGSHAELVNKNGYYHSIFALQNGESIDDISTSNNAKTNNNGEEV